MPQWTVADGVGTCDPLTPSPGGLRAHLVCSLGTGLYALDVQKVRHISLVDRVWRVPCLPDFVMGVTCIRGRLVPLVRLSTRLGLPKTTVVMRPCVVEMDLSVPIAVVVDSVEAVARFDVRDIQPVPRIGGNADSHAVTGVVTYGSQLCMLLDIDWVLFGERSCSSVRATTSVDQSMPDIVLGSDDFVPSALVVRQVPCDHRLTRHRGTIEVPKSLISCRLVPQDEGLGLGIEQAAGWFDVADEQAVSAVVNPRQHVLQIVDTENPVDADRVLRLLSQPAHVGKRRIPGFRQADARLYSLAKVLVQLPGEFRAREAATLVAAELGCSTHRYRLTHFRYDLGKLRARHLAERVGRTLRYRLTHIGRSVFQAIERLQPVEERAMPDPEWLPRGPELALSA